MDIGSIKEVLVCDGVQLEYVKTDEQCADICTKAVAPNKWQNAAQLPGIETREDAVSAILAPRPTSASAG